MPLLLPFPCQPALKHLSNSKRKKRIIFSSILFSVLPLFLNGYIAFCVSIQLSLILPSEAHHFPQTHRVGVAVVGFGQHQQRENRKLCWTCLFSYSPLPIPLLHCAYSSLLPLLTRDRLILLLGYRKVQPWVKRRLQNK